MDSARVRRIKTDPFYAPLKKKWFLIVSSNLRDIVYCQPEAYASLARKAACGELVRLSGITLGDA